MRVFAIVIVQSLIIVIIVVDIAIAAFIITILIVVKVPDLLIIPFLAILEPIFHLYFIKTDVRKIIINELILDGLLV